MKQNTNKFGSTLWFFATLALLAFVAWLSAPLTGWALFLLFIFTLSILTIDGPSNSVKIAASAVLACCAFVVIAFAILGVMTWNSVVI